MLTLRSIGAVLGGYAAMIILVGATLAFLQFAFADAFPKEPGPYTGPTFVLVLELLFGLLAAIGGGYVCAWLAPSAEHKHVYALMGLLAVMGIASAVGEAGLKPAWSSYAMPVVGVLGLYGGLLLRRALVTS